MPYLCAYTELAGKYAPADRTNKEAEAERLLREMQQDSSLNVASVIQ